MILDDRLIAPGHEDKMLDSGLARFLDDMLKDRVVDDGEHFLGDRFGGREKPRSQAATGKTALRMRLSLIPSERCATLFWTSCRAIRATRMTARRKAKRTRCYSTRVRLVAIYSPGEEAISQAALPPYITCPSKCVDEKFLARSKLCLWHRHFLLILAQLS